MRIMITGANRGLGLEFVRQTLDRGDRVWAGCRDPGEAANLGALASRHPNRLTVLPLDVTDGASIEAAVAGVRSQAEGLDLLINNAGVNPQDEALASLSAQTMLHTFQVNSVGPLMVTRGFLDLLKRSDDPKVINVTSKMGSLTSKESGGDYSYCSSKAALNMLTRALAFDLRSESVLVVAVHPGWVQTDMGGSAAPLLPSESVRDLLKLIDRLRPIDTGKFFHHGGQELPW
jgi:NAD(P)-dependent dehydrogenase (short-subunit alcohol dehydrogenase family)